MLLAGDIGGTKTDLAVFSADRGSRAPIAQKRFPSRDYPSLEAIASEFIAGVDLPVTHASFAVAGPVERVMTLETGDADREKNMWAFTRAALELLETSLRARVS